MCVLFFLMHFNVMMSKRTQIHRQWEGARISDKALRRSGCWRDQRRSNRRRVPRVGSCSSAIHSVCDTTQGRSRRSGHALPQPGQERLILTVSVHVSFINCFKSLLRHLCDYRAAYIMTPACTFPFQARVLARRALKEI